MAATYLQNLALTSARGNTVAASIIQSGTLGADVVLSGSISQGSGKTAALGGLSFIASSAANFTNATVSNLSVGSSQSNSVAAEVIASGDLGTGVNLQGSITQAASKTATLSALAFNSSSTANFTNATVTNLSIASGNSNSVALAVLGTGSLANGITLTGNIAQAATYTATLRNTSWESSSTVNFANATVSNLTLTGASGSSVDNDALPTTITKDINASSVTAASISLTGPLSLGNTSVGTARWLNSKNYAGFAYNSTSTIATLTFSVSTSVAWRCILTITGSATTGGHYVSVDYLVGKAEGTAAATIFSKLMHTTDDEERIKFPSLSFNSGTGALTIAHQAATTDAGTSNWSITSDYVGYVGTPAAPTFS
jgi:hypothetical protein